VMAVVMVMMSEDFLSNTIGGLVHAMSEGVVTTFIIVVTHVDGCARSFDCDVGWVWDLFWNRKCVSRSVYGDAADVGRLFLVIGEARSVDGCGNTNVGLWSGGRVLRSVNGVVDFFSVGWLELSSITTFSLVDLSVVVLTRWNSEVDVSVRVFLVWKLDVDVCVLWFVFLRSSFVVDIDVFSTARTVTILLTSYMNFFGAKLLVSWRKIGRDGISVPSDAFRELDLALDVCGFGDFGRFDFCVVLVGRREDAKGDGDAGVKVQIDDFDLQRTLLECLS
jgi:hypothetical protein